MKNPIAYLALMGISFVATGFIINKMEQGLQNISEEAEKVQASSEKVQASAEDVQRSLDQANELLAEVKGMVDSWKYESASTFAADAAKHGVEMPG